MPLQTTLKEQWPELLSALTGIVAVYLQWFSIDADGIASTDIAMKWGSAHYKEAVNAFWSPLWSWLLIPFLRVLGHPYVCIRLLQFVLLLIALRWWRKWVSSLAHPESKLTQTMRLLGGINLACFSQSFSGTDFLACILTLEFIRKLTFQNPSFVVVGFWLALLFYAKCELLFFGSAAFLGLHIYNSFKRVENNSIGKTTLKTLGAFLLATAFIFPWVNTLQDKYNRWMLTSSLHYTNTYKFAGGVEHAWKEYGLISPPDDFSTFAWTDITTRTEDFQSLIQENNKSITGILSYNILKTVRLLLMYSAAGLISFVLLWPYRQWMANELKKHILISLALVLLYVAGQQPFLINDQHLWPVYLILSAYTVCIPQFLIPAKHRIIQLLLLSVFMLSGSVSHLLQNQKSHHDHELAQSVAPIVPKGAGIASCYTGQTWAVSFYNRYRDCGGIQGERTPFLAEDLAKYDIRYIIIPQTDLTKTLHCLQNIKTVKKPVLAGSWYVLKLL